MKECPCCRVMRGESYRHGSLCRDCRTNTELADEWEWYKIMQTSRKVGWIPAAMSGVVMMLTVAGKMTWFLGLFNLAVMAFAWLSYKKRNYPKRMADSRERMFLLKVDGKDPRGWPRYRTECP